MTLWLPPVSEENNALLRFEKALKPVESLVSTLFLYYVLRNEIGTQKRHMLGIGAF